MSSVFSLVVTSGPRLGDVEAGAVAAATSPRFSVVSGGVACIVCAGSSWSRPSRRSRATTRRRRSPRCRAGRCPEALARMTARSACGRGSRIRGCSMLQQAPPVPAAAPPAQDAAPAPAARRPLPAPPAPAVDTPQFGADGLAPLLAASVIQRKKKTTTVAEQAKADLKASIGGKTASECKKKLEKRFPKGPLFLDADLVRSKRWTRRRKAEVARGDRDRLVDGGQPIPHRGGLQGVAQAAARQAPAHRDDRLEEQDRRQRREPAAVLHARARHGDPDRRPHRRARRLRPSSRPRRSATTTSATRSSTR